MAEENSLEGLSPQIVNALRKAYADPETKPLILKALKKGDATLDLPGLEIEEVKATLQTKLAENDSKWEGKIREMQGQGRISEERNALASQGFSKEDIKAVEDLMQKEGIASYSFAAKNYRLEQQAAMPTPSVRAAQAAAKDAPPDDVVKSGNIAQWARQRALDDLVVIQRGGSLL
jgi:hypothetical protein